MNFTKNNVLNQMGIIDEKLIEEQSKELSDRDKNREFELMYAKFIAGLRLNTGMRIF